MLDKSPLVPRSWLGRLASETLHSIRRVRIAISLRSKLHLGRNNHFGARCYFRPPSFMHISDDVSFGSNVIVETNLRVGPQCLISSNVSFVGNDHAFNDRSSNVYWQGRLPPSTIILEGNNLIGHRVTIVGNVTIGKGAIVGAGAIVCKDLPSDMVCVGVPAKPIRCRWET